jgi:hypothetical protein
MRRFVLKACYVLQGWRLHLLKKTFPVDIWSVKKYGVEKWRKTLFWPVSDWELRSLYNDVDGAYVKTINETHLDLDGPFSVMFNLISEYYVSFIHAVMVVERLRNAGFSIEYSKSARHYPGLVDGNQSVLGLRRKGFPPRSPSTWERIRGRARSILEQGKYHGFDLSYYLGLSHRPHYLCFHYPDRDKQWYAESRGAKITIVHPRQFMPKGPFRPANNLPGTDQAVHRLISGLGEIAEKYGVHLNASHIEHLQGLTMSHLGLVRDYIVQIRQLLRLREQTSFLVDGLGNLFKRSLCIAGRREGFRTVGFTHGNTVGMNSFGTFAYVDLAMVDTYVVPTEASARLFSKLQGRYRLPHDRRVEIVSSDNDMYNKVWEDNRRKPLPSSIKTVMVIECPMTGSVNRDVYLFWAYQVELTLRVAKLMRKLGVKTILKRHPDRLAESEDLYDPYFDELMIEPFEKVYEVADALFFPYISSTTFGFSLLTNRPIIFFETMLNSVWDELHEPLKRRCRVVPSWLDANGRLVFEEDAFIGALMQEPEEPNDDFVRKYMFPG